MDAIQEEESGSNDEGETEFGRTETSATVGEREDEDLVARFEAQMELLCQQVNGLAGEEEQQPSMAVRRGSHWRYTCHFPHISVAC